MIMGKIGVLFRFVKIAILLSVVTGIAFTGKASAVTTYSGTVYTSSSSATPVSGVTVTIQDVGGNINLVTDANGVFSTTLGTPSSGYTAKIGNYQMNSTGANGSCSSCHGASMRVYGVATATNYTVSASAGTGGSVTPASQSVANGSTTSFTVTPNTGYTASSTVGGTCATGLWSGTTYTTGAVTAACSVSFSFTTSSTATNYIVSASAGTGGSVTPASQSVASGGSASLTVKANSGNAKPPSVGGTCSAGTFGTWINGRATYTISNVTGSCTVSFTFGKAPGVKTGAATNIGATTATLNGKVSPKNASPTARFEYGLTNAYGSSVAGSATIPPKHESNNANEPNFSSDVNAGGEFREVSAKVTGLACNTIYHFRVVAVNSNVTTPSNGSDSTFKTKACPASDFDGDGKSDILLRDAVTGQTQEWKMNGATVASTIVTTQNAGAYTATSGLQSVGVGDFDGDGKYELLWQDALTGDLSLWTTIDGTALATPVTGGPAATGLQVQGIGDFNGDGKSDILFRDTTTGRTSIWFMNGATVTSSHDTSVTPGVYTATTGWQAQGIGDFNGDGKADILWRDAVTGKTSIWLMKGYSKLGGGLTNAQADTYTSTRGLQVQAVGDLNGDGNADILWRDTVTGDTVIWFMKGTARTGKGVYTKVKLGTYTATTGWQVQAVGDYNGDGKADILLRYAGTGETYIWLMNGAVVTGAYTSSSPGAYTPTTGLQVISGETVR